MSAPKGNKNAKGCKTSGRPALFQSPEDLQKKIDEYFADNAKITICGLAFFLGFSSRQSLLDYENKVEFVDIIKKARLRVEMNYEEMLSDGKPTGAIFALKNMGWHDKTETEHNVSFIEPIIGISIIKK